MIRALIFDFDGLILDTEGAIFQAWQEVYHEHGQELPLELWTRIIGTHSDWDPVAELELKLARPLDRDAVRVAKRAREKELIEVLPLLPGVREWHAEARQRGLKLGVASSSRGEWVLGHLRRLGLDDWDCIRCRDDVRNPKPEPDVYQAVLECLGVDAGDAVAIEDSSHGVAAAKRAGLYCIAVPCSMTAGLDLSQADLCLRSLDEMTLEEFLRKAPGGAAR